MRAQNVRRLAVDAAANRVDGRAAHEASLALILAPRKLSRAKRVPPLANRWLIAVRQLNARAIFAGARSSICAIELENERLSPLRSIFASSLP